MRFVHVRRSTGIKTSGGGGGKGKRLAIYPVAHTARALACFRISGGRGGRLIIVNAAVHSI